MNNLLAEELRRRVLLIEAIDASIQNLFIFKEKYKTRRGFAQEQILKSLNLKKNNFLCRLINERMSAKGYFPILIRGDQYYKNLSPRI